jgi:hypothetical protein
VSGARASWRARVFGCVLAWLGTFCAFAVFANGTFENSDSVLTMHAARVLGQRGDSGLLMDGQGGDLLGERKGAEWITRVGSMGKIGAGGRAYVWFPMGHVWLLAPFTAIGARLDECWPGVERHWRDVAAPGADDAHLQYSVSYVHGHPVLTQGLISFLVPPVFAATSVLLLFVIARALGAAKRDAFFTAAAIAVATQFASLGRETLSDGPGLCFLLGVVLATVRIWRAPLGGAWSFVGGAAAGCSVLLRYQNALLVAVCLVAIVLACRRRRRFAELWSFALGGLPFLVLFLGVNHARFGSVFDTGYPKYETWFDQPLWVGLPKLFFAAGRGVMWFSPLLWLALPLAARARSTPQLRWFAWVLFSVPFVIFAAARGWQGGQCWAARYVTPGVVVLLAIVLPQARPWLERPRLWWALVGLGALVNLTGVAAPVRGQIQLASQAVDAEAAHAVAEGRMTEAERRSLDPADPVSWRPRYSPLHSNWTYAVLSRPGVFEDEAGQPRNGSDHTIEPMFGVEGVEPRHGLAPQRWEDRCGRHLWWRFWGDLLRVPGWLLLLPVLSAAVLLSLVGWRRVVADAAE